MFPILFQASLCLLMITVEYVREKYKQEYWDLSDEEVQAVLDFFYTAWSVMIKNIIEQAQHDK